MTDLRATTPTVRDGPGMSRRAAVLTVALITVLALVVPTAAGFVWAELAEPISGPRCVAPYDPTICERWEQSR